MSTPSPLAPPLRSTTTFLERRRPLLAIIEAVGTQVFIAGVNILTGVITARLLGPAGRGIYMAVTTWPQFLATVAFAGLGSAVVFRMRRFPESSGRIAVGALLTGVAHSLVVIGIAYLLLPFFLAQYDAGTLTLARFSLISVLVMSTYMLFKQAFAGVGAFRQFNFANLWPQLLYLLALLLLMPFGLVTPTSATVALLGTGALAALTTWPKFRQLVRPQWRGSFGETREIVSYSYRASPSDIVFALATNSDRLVLIPLLSPTELGFYAVAFSFSRVIQLVQPAIASVVFSHMAGRNETDGKRLHDHALRCLLVGMLVGVAALWAVGQPLLVFTYGAPFAAANPIFRLLLLEACLGALSQVTIQLFLSRDRPGVASTIQVIVLCVSLGALLVLVPRYGATGAAAALLLAGALRWLLLLGSIKGVLKLSLPRLYPGRDDVRYLLGKLR
jgi:O-antigen/teichoic acid export membrane protein